MKKNDWLRRIRYWFDCTMSKGPVAMTVLLFSVTAAIVLMIGVVAFFTADEGSLGYQVWMSLMHTLDAGTLAGNPTDNIPYLLMMSLATICGMFLTSVLIGIIATGVEDKLSELRKGASVVLEKNHTVIIGFDENIYTLLRELIEANANHKNSCVVVLGNKPKEEMEESIASRLPNTGTTRIICRSGCLHEPYALERCNVESCKVVILNVWEDAEAVKIILALSAYLKGKNQLNANMKIIASLQDQRYIEAAEIAGEGRVVAVYTKEMISRIIANTCRQHGLSGVFAELMNFGGNELYFETVPELTGKTVMEAMLSFSNAVVVGIFRNGTVMLNPPADTLIGKDDQLILLEEDDGIYELHGFRPGDETKICNTNSAPGRMSDHLVILGSNDKLPMILEEYDKYVKDGTRVVIVDDDLKPETFGNYAHIQISVSTETITRDLLVRLLDGETGNILLLNDDSADAETSDSYTLLRLILLREIADKMNRDFAITTEMRSVDNQRLASQARVDDFVIGSNFASLLVTQISENPAVAAVLTELLDEDGSELYMKDAAHYVALGVPVDGYTLTESAAGKEEIYVGYRHYGQREVVVNPDKRKTVVFGQRDQVIVIAKD